MVDLTVGLSPDRPSSVLAICGCQKHRNATEPLAGLCGSIARGCPAGPPPGPGGTRTTGRYQSGNVAQPPVIGGSPYHQDHQPFRHLERVVGHAVRMVYLATGAADLYAETGEPTLLAALERLWRNMAERHTYVTGGIGARYEGEAFGNDYELPNERAYAETL